MPTADFSLNDLYPGSNFFGDTDSKTLPDANDQESLQEATKEEAAPATNETKPSLILLAIIAIICIVVFLGVS